MHKTDGGSESDVQAPKSDREHSDNADTKRYPVASVEFARVETPFIIGVWIFCASLAKIGE
jgi:sodium/hydrogen exchanger-like protein 3